MDTASVVEEISLCFEDTALGLMPHVHCKPWKREREREIYFVLFPWHGHAPVHLQYTSITVYISHSMSVTQF